MIKREQGITLMALIITIIVLVILSVITIGAAYNSGIIKMGTEGAKEYATQAIEENKILNETTEYIDDVAHKIKVMMGNIPENGSYDEVKKVNIPDLRTGMIAVKFEDNGDVVEYRYPDDTWYDYDKKQWANAITKDNDGNITGYWVWIPRYEYKINSDKSIEVKFIPTSTTKADEGYKIHPAFQDGRNNNFKNGEWDAEISGFWVAKYPAGYQKNTITDNGNGSLTTAISNADDDVVYSDKHYTCFNKEYNTNPLNQNLTAKSSESDNEKISYPVFLPLTYAYNNISIGDMYTISREIENATDFYNLTYSADSHLLKNSEWGAVVYLTQSKYGRSGNSTNMNEVYINNYYTIKTTPFTSAITGVYGGGASTDATDSISSVKPYYEKTTGVNGSSTGNITGVYDLNGCIWDSVSAYISCGNTKSNFLNNGSSFTNTTADPEGYNKSGYSTKYATVYPYGNNPASDRAGSYSKYKQFADESKGTYGYGDAVLETSTVGSDNNRMEF